MVNINRALFSSDDLIPMGLLEDFLKLPPDITVRECYCRIYTWHTIHGAERIRSVYGREDDYSRAYAKLLQALPLPELATQPDMDFVFGQVIAGLMEWAYRLRDEHGIKTAAYAHYALNTEYNSGWENAELRESIKKSSLHKMFHYWHRGNRGNRASDPEPNP